MNLFEKMQAVTNEIKGIEKNMTVGNNPKYSYKAVSESDVIKAVNAAEKKLKLISIPYKQEVLKSENVKTVNSNGNPVLYYTHDIKMTTLFVNLEKPEERIEVESLGFGLDSGDKGLGKASTYARKYALLNAYKLVTGEDLDAYKSEITEPLTEDEKSLAIINASEAHPKETEGVLTHFGIESFADLDEKQKEIVYNQWNKKGWL